MCNSQFDFWYFFSIKRIVKLKIRVEKIELELIMSDVAIRYLGALTFLPIWKFSPGGHSGTEGAHKLVFFKIKKYPYSTDFWPKKHPYLNKNADFFQEINTPSFIKTLTLDEQEHVFQLMIL